MVVATYIPTATGSSLLFSIYFSSICFFSFRCGTTALSSADIALRVVESIRNSCCSQSRPSRTTVQDAYQYVLFCHACHSPPSLCFESAITKKKNRRCIAIRRLLSGCRRALRRLLCLLAPFLHIPGLLHAPLMRRDAAKSPPSRESPQGCPSPHTHTGRLVLICKRKKRHPCTHAQGGGERNVLKLGVYSRRCAAPHTV
jgi:hypothetical protein